MCFCQYTSCQLHYNRSDVQRRWLALGLHSHTLEAHGSPHLFHVHAQCLAQVDTYTRSTQSLSPTLSPVSQHNNNLLWNTMILLVLFHFISTQAKVSDISSASVPTAVLSTSLPPSHPEYPLTQTPPTSDIIRKFLLEAEKVASGSCERSQNEIGRASCRERV